MIGIFLTVSLILTVFYSIKVGAANLSAYEIINGLINSNAAGASIIWNIRIPRILAAIIAGACMGIEGAALITRIASGVGDLGQ